MARIGPAHQFFVIIVYFVQNAIHLAECQDRRIIVYMPRRIKTIHHHHHHVVLMDPDKTVMYLTNPHSSASKLPISASAEGFLLQETRAHDLRSHKHHGRHRHQQDDPQQQQQHYHYQRQPEHQQQQGADGSDSRPPPSYVEQQKMANHRPRNRGLADIDNAPSPPIFFSGVVPTSRDTGWRPIAPPVRDKRSKHPRLYARIVTTYD